MSRTPDDIGMNSKDVSPAFALRALQDSVRFRREGKALMAAVAEQPNSIAAQILRAYRKHLRELES